MSVSMRGMRWHLQCCLLTQWLKVYHSRFLVSSLANVSANTVETSEILTDVLLTALTCLVFACPSVLTHVLMLQDLMLNQVQLLDGGWGEEMVSPLGNHPALGEYHAHAPLWSVVMSQCGSPGGMPRIIRRRRSGEQTPQPPRIH